MAKTDRPQVVLVNRCFVVREEDRFLLVLKRSKSDSYNSNKWEVPGGKLDAGQDLTHAQEREVMEETGLLVQPTNPMVFVESFVIGEGRYKGLPYVALFSITKVIGGNLAISNEHQDHKWVSYQDILSYDLTTEVRKAAIVLEKYLK